jgi:hypothetical protein
MIGHIEVEYFPAPMLNHKEYEQDSQPDCGNGKEIDRYDLTEMIAKERFPGLGWWWSPGSPRSRDTVRSES